MSGLIRLLAILLVAGAALLGAGAALHPMLTGDAAAQLRTIATTPYWRALHLAMLAGSGFIIAGVWVRLVSDHSEKMHGIRIVRLHRKNLPVNSLRFRQSPGFVVLECKFQRLRELCDFLGNNLHRMRYDRYLRFGYPVATGVIEGACRHIVKDRMERAGMRWKVPGAQAMLEPRALYANGDWAAFQTYRIEHENTRLYPHAAVLEQIPWPIAA